MAELPRSRGWFRAQRRRLAILFLLGLFTAMAVSWGIAFFADPATWRVESAEAVFAHTQWYVHRWSGTGGVLIDSGSEAIFKRSWGTEQLIGPPDTQGPGDITTAWASQSQDGQMEWLLLDYEKPVVPTELRVLETYNPGALVKVSVITPGGEEQAVWTGIDPTPTGSGKGESRIPLKVNFAVRRVKIYLDSPAVPGWNEIDAVALVDQDGVRQWAVGAQASSTFATGVSSSGSPENLLPRWSGLSPPRDESPGDASTNPTLVAAGFGWPFLAMYGKHNDTTAPPVRWPNYRSFGGYVVAAPPVRPLPFRPIWEGLLLDGVIYGAALWILYLVCTRPLRVFREVMRLRRGQCLKCGYDLRYDFARGCPECGWHRDHHTHPADPRS